MKSPFSPMSPRGGREGTLGQKREEEEALTTFIFPSFFLLLYPEGRKKVVSSFPHLRGKSSSFQVKLQTSPLPSFHKDFTMPTTFPTQMTSNSFTKMGR